MRTPKIQYAILEVLEETRREGQAGLRFSEIKERVEKKIGHITKGTLGNALSTLLERGEIEKKLNGNGTVIYSLTEQYEKQEFKNIILRYIEKTPITDMEANFEDVPRVVFVSPWQKLGEEDTEVYFTPNWDEPSEGIATVLLNDFLRLPKDVKEGIARLLFWSYWAAIQSVHRLEKPLPKPLIELIDRSIEFVEKVVLKKAESEGNEKRVQLENSVLKILKITRKMFESESLGQFLDFARRHERIVEECERTILEIQGGWTHRGERIFHSYVRTPGEQIYTYLPLKESEKMLNTSVFNEFCRGVISLFKERKDLLGEIQGNFECAKNQVARYACYIDDLLALFKKRYFIIVYLFNVPLGRLEDKLFLLPAFQQWLQALREGNLTHRKWVFEESTIKTVEKAYRRVRRGQPPPPVPIDLEHWTLRDIYELHPRGKDEHFWLELLELLRSQAQQSSLLQLDGLDCQSH